MRISPVQNIDDCSAFRRLTHMPVPKLLHGTAIILLLLVAIGVTWAANTEANLVVMSQGRVRAVADVSENWKELTTEIASETGGQVQQVIVDVGQAVSVGEVLLKFETKRLEHKEAQLEKSIATLNFELTQLRQYAVLFQKQSVQDVAQVQAELDEAILLGKRDARKRDSDIRVAKANLVDAESQYQRYATLHQQRAVADRELEKAKTERNLAIENLAQAKLPPSESRIKVLKESLLATMDSNAAKEKELQIRLDNKQGEIEAGQWELTSVRFDIQRSSVVAQTAGVVTEIDVKVGDVLPPGKVGINTVRKDELAMIVYLTSNDVGNLEPGMPVRVRLDSYNFRDYGVADGKVVFVSPDSQVQQMPNGQELAAYRVTVVLDDHSVCRGPLTGDIRMGMTGTAEIVVERKTLLTLFLRKIRNTISLT